MVFDKVKDKFSNNSQKEKGSKGVIMPADPEVVEETADELGMSPEVIEDNIKRFQEISAKAFPMIDEKTVRGDEGSSAKEESTPSFLYSVYEDDDVLVIGGAKNIILNLADRLDLDNTETRAVTAAHSLAADLNGFSEHMVMDEVYMVPKEQRFASRLDKEEKGEKKAASNGGAQALQEKMEGIKQVEETGFVLETPERLEETLNLEDKKYFGLSVNYDRKRVRLALDPRSSDEDSRHSLVRPDGNILIPREIGVAFGLEHRDVNWGIDDGKIVGKIGCEDFREEDLVDEVKTSVVEDNIKGELQAHLSSNHTRTLSFEVGNKVALYLQPAGDELAIVATKMTHEAPTEFTVEVGDLGKATNMVFIEIPDEFADVLGIDDGLEHQFEWGIRGPELVGRVIR